MNFSAVLLAGGKSSRMSSDKALIELKGQLLWQRQLATLRRLCPNELFLSGGLRRLQGNALSLPWGSLVETIADEITGAGPLAGVAAALHRCSSPLLVVLAIDLPMMTTEFLRSLLRLCNEQQGVVPCHAEYCEPLAAVYPQRCAPLAGAALRNGDFSMQNFVRSAMEQELLIAQQISHHETPLFTNLNTPADLAAL